MTVDESGAADRDQDHALIRRRRRQIIVHSILYYRADDPLVSDAQFDEWCRELVRLQENHPDIAAEVEFAEAFATFTGATGFDLPLDDPGCNVVASRLSAHAGRSADARPVPEP